MASLLCPTPLLSFHSQPEGDHFPSPSDIPFPSSSPSASPSSSTTSKPFALDNSFPSSYSCSLSSSSSCLSFSVSPSSTPSLEDVLHRLSVVVSQVVEGARATLVPTDIGFKLNTSVVGCNYHVEGVDMLRAHLISSEQSVTEVLDLRREPTNPKDSNAVAVYWRDHQVGHLRSYLSVLLAPLFDDGHFEATCLLNGVFPPVRMKSTASFTRSSVNGASLDSKQDCFPPLSTSLSSLSSPCFSPCPSPSPCSSSSSSSLPLSSSHSSSSSSSQSSSLPSLCRMPTFKNTSLTLPVVLRLSPTFLFSPSHLTSCEQANLSRLYTLRTLVCPDSAHKADRLLRNYCVVVGCACRRYSHLFTLSEVQSVVRSLELDSQASRFLCFGLFCSRTYVMLTVFQANTTCYVSCLSSDIQSSKSSVCCRLFCRLLSRTRPDRFFRVASLSYAEVPNLSHAISLLGSLIEHSKDVNGIELYQSLLKEATKPELITLAKALGVNRASRGDGAKHDVLQAVLEHLRNQRTVSGDSLVHSKQLQNTVQSVIGEWVRITPAFVELIRRLFRLFFITSRSSDPLACWKEMLREDIGQLVFFKPPEDCQTATARTLFPSRANFLSYDASLSLLTDMQEALEAENVEEIPSLIQRARQQLVIPQNVSPGKEERSATLPAQRFEASWVYTQALDLAIGWLEKHGDHTQAVQILQELLRTPCCPVKRGSWYNRLSVNLHLHLKQPFEALAVCRKALADTQVVTGDRLELEKRAARLAKGAGGGFTRKDKEPVLSRVEKVTIFGRPSNSQTGVKSHFFLSDNRMCTVEELALEYYRDNGGWEGEHVENSLFRTLFGLLFWDIIFALVPHVWATSYQEAPLDLNTSQFSLTRRDMLEERLCELERGVPARTRALLSSSYSHKGLKAVGVQWKWDLSFLQDIAVGLGGPALRAICAVLSSEHAGWCGGLPDLCLWRELPENSKLDETGRSYSDSCVDNTHSNNNSQLSHLLLSPHSSNTTPSSKSAFATLMQARKPSPTSSSPSASSLTPTPKSAAKKNKTSTALKKTLSEPPRAQQITTPAKTGKHVKSTQVEQRVASSISSSSVSLQRALSTQSTITTQQTITTTLNSTVAPNLKRLPASPVNPSPLLRSKAENIAKRKEQIKSLELECVEVDNFDDAGKENMCQVECLDDDCIVISAPAKRTKSSPSPSLSVPPKRSRSAFTPLPLSSVTSCCSSSPRIKSEAEELNEKVKRVCTDSPSSVSPSPSFSTSASIVATASAVSARAGRRLEVRLVEVKGPKDKLSAQQTAWLELLSQHIAVVLFQVQHNSKKGQESPE